MLKIHCGHEFSTLHKKKLVFNNDHAAWGILDLNIFRMIILMFENNEK